MPPWLRPTGHFGVGLQSLFLVCNSFKCITKTRSGECYDMTFHSRMNQDGYINVVPHPGIDSNGNVKLLYYSDNRFVWWFVRLNATHTAYSDCRIFCSFFHCPCHRLFSYAWPSNERIDTLLRGAPQSIREFSSRRETTHSQKWSSIKVLNKLFNHLQLFNNSYPFIRWCLYRTSDDWANISLLFYAKASCFSRSVAFLLI